MALAVLLGMLHTVNLLYVRSPGDLAHTFVARSVAALCGLLSALPIVVLAGRRRFERSFRRWTALPAAVLAAAAVGTSVEFATLIAMFPTGKLARFFMSWSLEGFRVPTPNFLPEWLAQISVRYLVIAALVATFGEAQRRSLLATQAVHDERLRGIALQSQLSEARLHMLQAQIEPHFLFNSLANVRRLTRLSPPAGAQMLAELTHYFEATLPRLRADESTLEREAELARAFLAVHQIRMAERLTVEFAIPPDLVGIRFPPMMLLTLVENALKHALGPLPEGGCIRIEASRAGGSVHVSVADNGRGLVPGHGKGSGLANIRARLRSSYGPEGQLTLRVNAPRGVVASIRLPEVTT
ncbi:MAG: histidine kinase [Caldimonas sp.]